MVYEDAAVRLRGSMRLSNMGVDVPLIKSGGFNMKYMNMEIEAAPRDGEFIYHFKGGVRITPAYYLNVTVKTGGTLCIRLTIDRFDATGPDAYDVIADAIKDARQIVMEYLRLEDYEPSSKIFDWFNVYDTSENSSTRYFIGVEKYGFGLSDTHIGGGNNVFAGRNTAYRSRDGP